MSDSMISKKLPKQPHPETGELFVEGEISIDNNDQLVEFYELEPRPPTREVEDSEGYEVVRSDDEMRKLREEYKVAHAEWVKRGSPRGPSLHRIAGERVVHGKFLTGSGAKAEGVMLPDGSWRWIKLDWK